MSLNKDKQEYIAVDDTDVQYMLYISVLNLITPFWLKQWQPNTVLKCIKGRHVEDKVFW